MFMCLLFIVLFAPHLKDKKEATFCRRLWLATEDKRELALLSKLLGLALENFSEQARLHNENQDPESTKQINKGENNGLLMFYRSAGNCYILNSENNF